MKKKTKIMILSVIALVLVTIGISYAYWLVTKSQEGENVITTGCLDITLNGENDITLSNQFPLSDEDGMKLTPYTFTVTNNCTTSVDYQINLEATGTESSAIKTTAIKVALDDMTPAVLDDKIGTDTTIAGAYEARQLYIGTLAPQSNTSEEDTASFELRLWIDKDAPISEMNKTFKSKISVTVGQGILNPFNEGTLAYDILSNNGGIDAITEVTDFSVATTAEDAGLYKAEDNFGTSYYFRGAPTNNYVKFGTWQETVTDGFVGCYDPDQDTSCDLNGYETLEACEANMETHGYVRCKEFKYGTDGKDMYWRIVRINGDGTIRLVYDGMEKAPNGSEHTAIVGKETYNEYFQDEKYLGYTYDKDGIETDSVIKDAVDRWYENNLKTNYEKYIADSIFCNDRQITKYKYFDNNSRPIDKAEDATYIYKYYGAHTRLDENKTPSLKCEQKADRYTTNTNKGNGSLTNPVGLITADEVVMAGAKHTISNSSYYLYQDYNFWTMTPKDFTYSEAGIFFVNNSNGLGLSFTFDEGGYTGVRPVINLKADVEFINDGSFETPYEIVMN